MGERIIETAGTNLRDIQELLKGSDARRGQQGGRSYRSQINVQLIHQTHHFSEMLKLSSFLIITPTSCSR
jgi:hypothetical protein